MHRMRFLIPESAPSGRVLLACDRTFCKSKPLKYLWKKNREECLKFIHRYADLFKLSCEKRTENVYFCGDHYTYKNNISFVENVKRRQSK